MKILSKLLSVLIAIAIFANVSVEKLESIAKFLGTNLPDLVTDWKDGSYPDEHEEYDRGYSDGRKDMLKEIIEKEAK